MARVSLFNSPLLLGFEHFEDIVDQITKKSADGYPPYNIEQISGGRLRITLAVAGFAESDLSVEVTNSQLEIRGRHLDDGDVGGVFLHRGIAARQFRRAFILADGLEVDSAELINGLLNIDLVRPEPETRVRKVVIKMAGGSRSSQISVDPHADRTKDKTVD